MSGSGPFGPILAGVWQSWQPMAVTRYFPRPTDPPVFSAVAAFAAAPVSGAVPAPAPVDPAPCVPPCADAPATTINPADAVTATSRRTHRSITSLLDIIVHPPSTGPSA